MRIKPLYIAGIVAIALVAGVFLSRGTGAQDLPAVTVYKSPSCGCCSKWVTHLEENGFEVKAIDTHDTAKMKMQHGVPGDLTACHTALVDGYVVEGHVPADVVKTMLTDRPEIDGITVPGMPMGSPGMEGDRVDNYDIIAFRKDGKRAVYASR